MYLKSILISYKKNSLIFMLWDFSIKQAHLMTSKRFFFNIEKNVSKILSYNSENPAI